jgi:hypothetical protein
LADKQEMADGAIGPHSCCRGDHSGGDCERGVVENLPDAVDPVPLNGYTYHPQNMALPQWFDTGQPSDALGGAFSYPDESVLTSPAAYQNVNCS